MRIPIDKKAVSIFILIILMLCSAVFGAIIAYLGVMTSYYNMPENTRFLIVENVVFPVPPFSPIVDASYFNVTLLNPSNSASDINITAIRLIVEGKNKIYNITSTEPALATMGRGTRQTFKCEQNWSNFAGETVRIEPVAVDVLISSSLYAVPKLKLILTPHFDPSESIEHFNLTIENSQSITNLTISQILLFAASLNATPTLPYVLPVNQTQTFQFDYNWDNLRGQNVTLTVKTAERYETSYTTQSLPSVSLSIEEVGFDYTNTTYFNVDVRRSGGYIGFVVLDKTNLTQEDGTTITFNITETVYLLPNYTTPLRFNWDWTTYRNKRISVEVYTRQGFKASRNATTPPEVVWDVTDIKFDLDDISHFLVNVTNFKASLHNITITQIRLNQIPVLLNQTVLQPGEQKAINCTYYWQPFIGSNVNITVTRDSAANISRTIQISPVGLKLLNASFFEDLGQQYLNTTTPFPIPYFNLTISNSNNSLRNVTIMGIILNTGNTTFEIEYNLTYPKLGSSGYILKIGETTTFMCEWDWTRYSARDAQIEIIVYTQEGFVVSKTFQV
ncbi:hypothetical protein HXY32_04760 [Candidatus Bathyarchaeota archaeon]|nr:hypothetical protein [Candidatus Bathyarchaeota archaeon]